MLNITTIFIHLRCKSNDYSLTSQGFIKKKIDLGQNWAKKLLVRSEEGKIFELLFIEITVMMGM